MRHDFFPRALSCIGTKGISVAGPSKERSITPEIAFKTLIVPALIEYSDAERALSRACADKSGLDEARAAVLRRGRTATIELHQFSDRVMLADPRPAWLPDFATLDDLRHRVEEHCVFMGGDLPVKDVTLLHDIADAYKHVRLRPGQHRRLLSDDATAPVTTGWGNLAWGEGKWDGVEQAIVTTLDGRQRALHSILLNAANAWLSFMGQARDQYLMDPSEAPDAS